MFELNKTTTLTLISFLTPLDTDKIIHNALVLISLLPSQLIDPRSGRNLRESVKTGFRQLTFFLLMPLAAEIWPFWQLMSAVVARLSCRKPVEFKKNASGKNRFS